MNNKIRLHIPAVPYTITRDEYSHDAFTGKVKRFSPMMRSRGFEVYHYGVETSESGANKDIQLLTKEEWTKLRIESLIFLEPQLTLEEAEKKNNDPTMIISHLSNWNTPLTVEFNKRLLNKLKENYRSNQTDIICIPLSRTYHDAISSLDAIKIEIGIGYSGSYLDFRVFESYSWMSHDLGRDKKNPQNYWFVIPHFFNINDFKLCLNPTPLKVGFMARLVSTKGCGVIVEIAKKFPHVQFVLCGSGDPNPFLQYPNIVYKPPIHGNERSDYLGSCIALLSPTTYLEPFGCAQVEAQLCGTPVICSDWGGMVETVEQYKTGLLCHTLADYCYGIQMAIDGAFDRQYIRDRATKLYDMYTLANKYEYVFKTVLDVFKPNKGWYSKDTYIKPILTIKNRNPRIYKFMVYYGDFPNYFQLYLDSLEINKDVLTVFLVTDINIEMYNIPSNLILINLSMQNIRERAAKLINEAYNKVVEPDNLIQNKHKLCDFKIVYPKLFEDIIQEYNITEKDYVCWGDCDLIYGKISNVIQLDKNYEILGNYQPHFTAIKNTELLKNSFMQIPNFFELITDNSKPFTPCETYLDYLLKYLEEKNVTVFYSNAYSCVIVPPCFYYKFRPSYREQTQHFFDKDNCDKNISYLFFDKINKKLLIKYEKTEDTDIKEVLYCHLQKRQMTTDLTNYENGFYINEYSFTRTLSDISNL